MSGLLGARLAKYGLLGAGILLFGPGLILLGSGADHAHNGLRVIFLAFGLLGWGIASPLRYSVNLHRRGSVRSLLTTHDAAFASRVSHLINNGLADSAAMPTYRIDPKTKRIMAD